MNPAPQKDAKPIKNVHRALMRALAPPTFFRLSAQLAKGLGVLASLLLGLGLWKGLVLAPVDATQGEVYRVLYLHVPAAWMSMFLYTLAAAYGVIHWIYRTPVSAVMLRALLPTGAWMSVLALITGALWGKPTWGTYWVWDARLTSTLLLLFIYLGLIAVSGLSEDHRKVDRALSLFCVVGLVNIPLIYFSVVFWNTLHQGASLAVSGAPRMDPQMKNALLFCTLGLWCACAAMALARARWLLVQREAAMPWVRKALG